MQSAGQKHTDDRVPAGQLSERRNGEQRTGGTRLEHGALERPRPHVVHVGCSSPRLNRAAAGYDVGRVRQRRGATRPDARTGEGAACLAAHVPREVARLHHGQRGHGRRTARYELTNVGGNSGRLFTLNACTCIHSLAGESECSLWRRSRGQCGPAMPQPCPGHRAGYVIAAPNRRVIPRA